MPVDLVEHLRTYLGKRVTGPLFPGRSGQAVSIRHVQRRFAAWQTAATIGRKVTVHGLRHGFATRLYERTSDLPLVQRALGHRAIASTLVYARADDHRLRAALSA